MSRLDPGAATGQPDWSRYRKCPACHAELGEECRILSGAVRMASGVITASVAAEQPHGGRKLRAGAVA